jgi:hypothetical protein
MLRIEPRLAFINGVLLANRVLIFCFQLLAVYVLLVHNCGECRIVLFFFDAFLAELGETKSGIRLFFFELSKNEHIFEYFCMEIERIFSNVFLKWFFLTTFFEFFRMISFFSYWLSNNGRILTELNYFLFTQIVDFFWRIFSGIGWRQNPELDTFFQALDKRTYFWIFLHENWTFHVLSRMLSVF